MWLLFCLAFPFSARGLIDGRRVYGATFRCPGFSSVSERKRVPLSHKKMPRTKQVHPRNLRGKELRFLLLLKKKKKSLGRGFKINLTKYLFGDQDGRSLPLFQSKPWERWIHFFLVHIHLSWTVPVSEKMLNKYLLNGLIGFDRITMPCQPLAVGTKGQDVLSLNRAHIRVRASEMNPKVKGSLPSGSP